MRIKSIFYWTRPVQQWKSSSWDVQNFLPLEKFKMKWASEYFFEDITGKVCKDIWPLF